MMIFHQFVMSYAYFSQAYNFFLKKLCIFEWPMITSLK